MAEKDFTVVLDMPFTKEEFGNGLYFTKFLPREKESIEVNEGRFSIKIYFSYNRKHLNHVSNDFIKRQSEIRHFLNITVNSLRFKINTSIPRALYDELGKEILNSSTEEFCKEVMRVALKLYHKIFDYSRNIKKQFWLLAIEHHKEHFVDFFLKTNAVWEYNGNPQRLYLKNHVTTLEIIIDSEFEKSYLSRRLWKDLGEFLQTNSTSKTEQVFLSNGLFYLTQKQTRVAILEAVIALEHTIKKNNCEKIKRFIPKEEFEYIKKLLLKKNQFSIPLGLILAKVKKSLELKGISAEYIIKAIEIRNMIMHNSQKEIKYSTARKCILNIEKFIEFIS